MSATYLSLFTFTEAMEYPSNDQSIDTSLYVPADPELAQYGLYFSDDPHLPIIQKAFSGNEQNKALFFEKVANNFIIPSKYNIDYHKLLQLILNKKTVNLTDNELHVLCTQMPNFLLNSENAKFMPELMRRALELKHAPAEYTYAVILCNGNAPYGLAMAKLAAQKGFAPAQHFYGKTLYNQGNKKEGIKWQLLAVAQNYAPALCDVGMSYFFIRHRNSYVPAYQHIFSAAAQGYPEAYYWMGVLSYHGIKDAIYQNYALAYDHFRQACTYKHEKSIYYMGQIFEHGYGQEKDYKKAFTFYNISWQLGYLPAQREIAKMYVLGLGVEQDIPKGTEILMGLISNGDKKSNHNELNGINLLEIEQPLDQTQETPPQNSAEKTISVTEELVRQAKNLFLTNHKEGFKKYLEAQELGNEEAIEFLNHYQSAKRCTKRDRKHTQLHQAYAQALKEFKAAKEPIKTEEPPKSKKQRRKKKEQQITTSSSPLVQSLTTTSEEVRPTQPIITEPPKIENKEEIVTENITPSLPLAPLTQVETTPTTSYNNEANGDNNGSNEDEDKDKMKKEKKKPRSRRHSMHLEKGAVKEGSEQIELPLERKKRSKEHGKLSRTQSLAALSVPSPDLKGEESTTRKEKKSSKTLQRTRSSILPKVPKTEETSAQEITPLPISRRSSSKRLSCSMTDAPIPAQTTPRVLTRKLSSKDLKNLSQQNLSETLIEKTLGILKEKGLVSWKKKQGKDNKYKAATTFDGKNPWLLEIHTHSNNGLWYKKPEIVTHFFNFVGHCDPELAKQIKQEIQDDDSKK